MRKSHILKNIKILLLLIIFLFPFYLFAADNFTEKLAGKILLQVESRGEAWYLNPGDYKRYYLGKPIDAFDLMRELGIGISNIDLNKIPIGIIKYNDVDSDNDGLTNRLEIAIGTNYNMADTDNDGYSDFEEIQNNYNPIGAGKQLLDFGFSEINLGKIFLQTEKNGEAWYVNPKDNKRYFLGRPADALDVMKNLGLGISNINLGKISIAYLQIEQIPTENQSDIPSPMQNQTTKPMSASAAISGAANAIRSKNVAQAVNYFMPEMKKAIEYNFDNMPDEAILALGNILSGSKLTSSTESEKIYSNDVYFSLGDQYIHLDFIVKKQDDGSWLLVNL